MNLNNLSLNHFLKKNKNKILFISLFALFFILLTAYIEIQNKTTDYYLYLIGDDFSSRNALVRIVSKDGLIVPRPEIYINGKLQPSTFIKIPRNIHTIGFKVGKKRYDYKLNLLQLLNFHRKKFTIKQFSQKEKENFKTTLSYSSLGNKKVFLLPETFRMIAEYPIKVHFFCFENNQVCKDKIVYVNGKLTQITNGYFTQTIKMNPSQQVTLKFENSAPQKAIFPYLGKMFFIKDMILYSLTNATGVNLDCFRNQKWLFSELVSTKYSGIKFPKRYNLCDKIQVSFNSVNPRTTFLVYSKKAPQKLLITDYYYQQLFNNLKRLMPDKLPLLKRIYSQSIFYKLNIIFDGKILIKQFEKEKAKKLSIIWFSILILSIISIVFFALKMLKQIKEIKDEDGELLTKSLKRQKTTVFIETTLIALFLFGLLYLLKNMA